MPRLNRRQVIAGVAAGSVTSIGGCLGHLSNSSSPAQQSMTFPEDPDEFPVNDDEGIEDRWEDWDETERIKLGSREGIDDAYGPHGIRVINAADAQPVEFGVFDVLEDEVIHHERYDLDHDEYLEVSLLRPSKYLVKVRLPDAGTEHGLRVPCNLFDCNSSSTNLEIVDDDHFRSSVISTMVACHETFDC